MPMTCVAYGCHNYFVKGCGKQFFRFPLKDPERLSKWVIAIRRKNWKPSASSRICSDHFAKNDYMLRPNVLVPRLRLDAVPSIFDGFPSHLKERLERKKTQKEDIAEEIIVIDNELATEVDVQVSFDSEEPKDTCQNSERLIFSPPEAKEEAEVCQEQKVMKNELDKVKICAVYGCHNTCCEGCQQLFFRFPSNDPELLSKWLEAMHREKASASSGVCSDHFTEKDYIFYPGALVPKLGPDAVPSRFIELPTQVKSHDTQQADPNKNGVPSEPAKDQILMPSKIIKTNLHVVSNKESLSEQKQQVKHGSLERSHAVKCVVHGCNSVFVKGCGKRFFRFPVKSPERLSKWVKALQCSDWKQSASSRICSDHFKEKDYIFQPGTLLPRLRSSAVPSVFKARKRRRKPITATHQNLEHCRSMVDGFQETETHRPCDHTYSAVHNEVVVPHFNPDAVKLKKKVRTLQRQIQRQRHTIKKLSERITQLRNSRAQLHQT
ncbi:uncharacterized protein LOC122920184 isoform X1 [Bufo gargarizans]|uniref:uncharacterized protein LOC122920184 isoform X1 n=2 Tax=Bufo gargarizans TaxID=30331 RepID=UPI001CF179D8|nr:uncharacterized protein LOC122920184 isoform X1 [Bufo gargarizans]